MSRLLNKRKYEKTNVRKESTPYKVTPLLQIKKIQHNRYQRMEADEDARADEL